MSNTIKSRVKSLLPGSVQLMLNGVPGQEIGVNAMTIVGERKPRCHGGPGLESADLPSLGESNVRFLRMKQRKPTRLCTRKSRFAVNFPCVPLLLLLVPGVPGQCAAKPAMLRAQTHPKEAGNGPARKPHFQPMKS